MFTLLPMRSTLLKISLKLIRKESISSFVNRFAGSSAVTGLIFHFLFVESRLICSHADRRSDGGV
jgi:hypothetical protein